MLQKVSSRSKSGHSLKRVDTKRKPWCSIRTSLASIRTGSWLNYHHLLYFWNVARLGSIARAAAELRLTEPTVSAQIHALERSIGEKLFRREGRALVLTEAGRLAERYASEIFTLGQEFQATIGGLSEGRAARLTVGVADVVPRLIVFRLLEPAVHGPKPFAVSCRTDSPERLLTALAAHEIDVVISDGPLESTAKQRTYNRLLGESDVTIFGAEALAARCRRGFPASLDGKPFLLPAENTALRRSLDAWFVSNGVRPDVRGEFTDSMLMKTFGRAGVGAFAAPTAIAREVKKEYRVRAIGLRDTPAELAPDTDEPHHPHELDHA